MQPSMDSKSSGGRQRIDATLLSLVLVIVVIVMMVVLLVEPWSIRLNDSWRARNAGPRSQ